MPARIEGGARSTGHLLLAQHQLHAHYAAEYPPKKATPKHFIRRELPRIKPPFSSCQRSTRNEDASKDAVQAKAAPQELKEVQATSNKGCACIRHRLLQHLQETKTHGDQEKHKLLTGHDANDFQAA